MGFLTFTNSHLFVIQHIYREHFFIQHMPPHPNHLSDKISSELLLSVSPDPCEAELVFV